MPSEPMTAERSLNVRPFSNGTEGYDWMAANCERCARNGSPNERGESPCPMETAVSFGFIIGTVPAELAEQYGAEVRGAFADMPRQCSQFVPLGFCESIATRRRQKCGQPATTTVVANGLTRPVCARHRRSYLAACAKDAAATLAEPPHAE